MRMDWLEMKSHLKGLLGVTKVDIVVQQEAETGLWQVFIDTDATNGIKCFKARETYDTGLVYIYAMQMLGLLVDYYSKYNVKVDLV